MNRKPLTAIRRSARGEDCQIRIPMICNFDPATTVLAHLGGGGVGRKQPDLMAAYSCSACHDVIDGRRQTDFTADKIKLWHYEAVFRTQDILVHKGLIKI